MAVSTSTQAVSAPEGVWTLLISGAGFSKATLQIDDMDACAIAVADSAPASDSNDYIVLSRNGDRSVTIDLVTANRIYGRGIGGDATLRALKTAV